MLLASVLAGLATPADCASTGAQDPRFSEHRLASVPEGIEPDDRIVFSPDGTRVAYAATKSGKSVAVVGDDVSDTCDFVDPPVFAENSAHVAFRVGKRNSKERETWWVLLDGKKTGECDWIGALSWSPDGSKLAYWTQPGARMDRDGIYTGGAMVLVVGSRKSEKWNDADALTPPVWSRNSKVVATSAMKNDQWFVLIGDKPPLEAPMVDGVTLSDDGKVFAYAAVRPAEEDLGYGSADPVGMAWIVRGPKKEFGTRYDSAASPVLSPDGRSLAYKASKSGKVGIAVDDDKAALEWDFVSRAVWAPNGKSLAFAGVKDCEPVPENVTAAAEWNVKGGTWQLVADGKPKGETYDEIRDITFSADSKRIAHRARSGKTWRIVCGEARSEPFDFVGEPWFSADGKLIAFGVRSGRELLWKVMALP